MKKPAEPTNEKIVLMEDPFGMKNNEIAEAQESSEPIDENFDIDESDISGRLDSLARALQEESEKQERENTELAEAAAQGATAAAEELAEQLAREIAEDQALAQEMAKQAEEMEAVDPELAAALPQSLDVSEIRSCVETLLFMSDKPISVEKLRELLGPDFPLSVFQEAVTSLKDAYAASHHGIEVIDVGGGLQFRTKAGRAALARKLAKVQTQKLSSGAMETLAIVAYRQPVMKEDIDKIRGVDSSYFVRGLLDRKLIKISGRSELPGRPMVYSTTEEFLQLFGLKDLSSMPTLREIEQMVPASQSGNTEDEDPRVRQMRNLVNQMKSDTSTSLIYDHREDEMILQEIRERVQSIPTSTPYLDEQKALERESAQSSNAKAAVEAGAKHPRLEDLPEQPTLADAARVAAPVTELTPEQLAAEMVSQTLADAADGAEIAHRSI